MAKQRTRIELEAARDAAVRRGTRWTLTVDELLAAYAAGMRDFRGATLSGADLRWANLRGADLDGADLSGANLRDANLDGADLRGAYLYGAYLSGADLRWANLRGANLRGADLDDADLYDANLRGANLRGANLDSTVLDPASTHYTASAAAAFAIDGEYLIGYRTHKSRYIGDTVYEAGETYTAPYFSVCEITECHPGLYVHPTRELGNDYVGYGVIQVRFKATDLIQAGAKYRVRSFEVMEVLEAYHD